MCILIVFDDNCSLVQYMTLSADQHKEIGNHELFGNAAAYHVRASKVIDALRANDFVTFQAATAFTDHVEKNGLPESQPEAQKLMYV